MFIIDVGLKERDHGSLLELLPWNETKRKLTFYVDVNVNFLEFIFTLVHVHLSSCSFSI